MTTMLEREAGAQEERDADGLRGALTAFRRLAAAPLFNVRIG